MASLANYVPYLRYNSPRSRTWATAGNTDTVTDGDVKTTSLIVIQNTTVPVGRWSVAVSNGQFVVTSSDPESATATYNYRIL